MKKLYAAALFATNGFSSNAVSCSFLAANYDEAQGKAIGFAREMYPEKDGWWGHQASVARIPDEYIIEAMSHI